MNQGTAITIELPPGLSSLVEAKVRSGLYSDPGEVVREALRLWDASAPQTEDPELEQLIEAGLAGPFKTLTAGSWRRLRRDGQALARAHSTRQQRKAAS
jgi:putative addiction module CopG family antidote